MFGISPRNPREEEKNRLFGNRRANRLLRALEIWEHVSVAEVVRIFRKYGAECKRRKRRGETFYTCTMGVVEATIDRSGITIEVPGELRTEYLDARSEGGAFGDLRDFEREVERALGCDAYIDAEGRLSLVLGFPLEEGERAARVASWFHREDVYPVLTNMRGSLRIFRRGRPLEREEEEWKLIEDLKKLARRALATIF